VIKIKSKSLSCLAVVLLLVGGFTTLGISQQTTTTAQTINLHFTTPTTTQTTIDSRTYTELTVPEADHTLIAAGAPAIPMTTTTLELLFGTVVTSVDVVPQATHTMTLLAPVKPSPQAFPDGQTTPTTAYVDPAVYASAQYYPAAWFDYSTGGGLNANGEHTTFLVIRTFPARVSPATNTVQYLQDATITVTYRVPTTPKTFGIGYDLVIITPRIFNHFLTPLVKEKNSHGVNTTVMTLDTIYKQYQGYDKPEKIKYFIKYALDTWNTKYVLLVGGMKGYFIGNGGRDDTSSGVKNWYCPVRYANNDEGGTVHDPGLISDLYYADIYDSAANFSSWDTNGDHVYGKWVAGQSGKDTLDLYPDIAVGRLTCRNIRELRIMVDKIITYEASPADPTWFNREVLIGGDTFDDTGSGDINEGEVSTLYDHNESLANFTPIELFASNRNISNDSTPTPLNIIREVTKGCGFLHFDGHGNPISWNTHWHDLFSWKKGQTPGGIHVYDMWALLNGRKLPICIVGGCHNSMINVSILWTLSNNTYTWTKGTATPRCWSEWMIAMNHGGAIACMGNTGLGYGLTGDINGTPACYQGLGGLVERTFLQAYNASTNKTLGNAWAGAITRYLNIYPGMGDLADAKTVEEWLALGDPSLMIGGYPIP